MFAGCSSLYELPSTFKLSRYVQNVTGMFHGCTNLNIINEAFWPNFHFISLTIQSDNMFKYCRQLKMTLPGDILWGDGYTIGTTSKKSGLWHFNLGSEPFIGCSQQLSSEVPPDWR